ncbi:hypothetical protein LZD49_03425 [Dyadobacter sp. CY261]|uniref:hypothetical protein n=1 Tax=Dyadobacter sp. CY261 TaxID=2907203 RepID=UPI001F34722A|nr:hypothetical protein [Dyadobacter sp. CY261]MCF0069506.1 hypothetical protein [Dyadobacter sp. CY261]
MENHHTVADLAFCAYEHIMPAGETIADDGVGIDDRAGVDARAVAQYQRLAPARVLVAQHHVWLDLGVGAKLAVSHFGSVVHICTVFGVPRVETRG